MLHYHQPKLAASLCNAKFPYLALSVARSRKEVPVLFVCPIAPQCYSSEGFFVDPLFHPTPILQFSTHHCSLHLLFPNQIRHVCFYRFGGGCLALEQRVLCQTGAVHTNLPIKTTNIQGTIWSCHAIKLLSMWLLNFLQTSFQ